MKSLAFALLFFSFNSFAGTRVFQCAEDNVSNYSGARVNLNRMEDGELKANLLFGQTVSGTTYHVKEISKGIYEGSIKNKPQYKIKLEITSTKTANRYISGSVAKLEVTYPTFKTAQGYEVYKTHSNDQFVCGIQISRFGL